MIVLVHEAAFDPAGYNPTEDALRVSIGHAELSTEAGIRVEGPHPDSLPPIRLRSHAEMRAFQKGLGWASSNR